jgi:hypothetical protein
MHFKRASYQALPLSRRATVAGLTPMCFIMRSISSALRISTSTLRNLVARGPEAAHPLYERMRALGISEVDVHRAADGVMRDLQRTCAVCRDKGVCEWDLRKRPDDAVWKSYCHNAVTLESLTKLKANA